MSKRKLLLADDSVTIQKVVNLTFADEGIEVISVGDGDSAMEKVVEISPDLIMADVNMPGLTGYQICERIRQDEKLSQTPVILLVGSFEPFDEDEARRVGADDYLTKPFQSIRQLVNKVTVLLNSAGSKNGGTAQEMKDSSSLEDTLEMDVEEVAPISQTVQYDDSGYDDEMIQTNQVANFAFDETQKFESRETGESTSQQISESQESNEDLLEDMSSYPSEEIETTVDEEFETYEESIPETIQTNENYSDEIEESQPISDELEETEIQSDEIEKAESVSDEITFNSGALPEIERYGYTSDETETVNAASEEIEEAREITEEVEENEYISFETKEAAIVSDEISDEIISDENVSADFAASDETFEQATGRESEDNETDLAKTASEDEMPLPEFASVLEFDEDDILQLPPIELDSEDEEEAEPTIEEKNTTSPVQTTAFVSTAGSNDVINSSQISPELIDAIVQKVLERLSEKAIKEVAWEVVPQMTELIVKKMAEERLKN